MRILLAVALLVAARPALAAQAVAVSIEELARTSDAVVRGKVVDATARWNDERLRIFTIVELERTAVLRGRAPFRVRVAVPGGVVGRVGQRVDGAPVFARGEEVVLFLRRSAGDAFGVNGLAQGKFTVTGAVVRPDLSHLTFLQTSVPAGERRAEQ